MALTLYIVRHGIAVARDEAPDDRERALTSEGNAKTRRAALGLRALSCKPQLIMSGEYPRAMQTARILEKVLVPPHGVRSQSLLNPGAGEPTKVFEALNKSGMVSVMVVGHIPDIADLAAAALSKDRLVNFRFKKAGAAKITFQKEHIVPAGGTLEWLLPAAILRSLAA